MKRTLIVATEKRFYYNNSGHIVDQDNTRSVQFWNRYLSVFDNIIILGRLNTSLTVDNNYFVENDNIKLLPLPFYQGTINGILKYNKLRCTVKRHIKNNLHSSFLLRLPGAIGLTVADILIKEKLKFSVEVVGDIYDVYSSLGGIKNQLFANYFSNRVKSVISKSISASYVTTEYLQKRYPNPHHFSYSSINLKKGFFSENRTISLPISIIGIGTLDVEYKGVEYLLEALKILKKNNIEFSMTWIGDGKLKPTYDKFIEANKLEKEIKFIGRVDNDSIPIYLEKNNVFIIPSLTEGLPRALIEAMASGLICIGSRVGGIPELIPNECVFMPKKPDEIFNIIKKINNNFEHFKKYSVLNRKKALEFLPEKLEEKRNIFYKTIVINEIN